MRRKGGRRDNGWWGDLCGPLLVALFCGSKNRIAEKNHPISSSCKGKYHQKRLFNSPVKRASLSLSTLHVLLWSTPNVYKCNVDLGAVRCMSVVSRAWCSKIISFIHLKHTMFTRCCSFVAISCMHIHANVWPLFDGRSP